MTAILAPAAGAADWDFPDNPDRFPSVLFTVNGAGSVWGRDEHTLGGVTDSRHAASFAQNTVFTTILPVSDSLSLTVTGGLNFSESLGPQATGFSSTVSDNSMALYQAGARYYFVGVEGPWPTGENPDRWPSIGLLGSGSSTVGIDVTNSVNGINQPLSTQGWRIDNENRFPLTNAYTLVLTVSGAYSSSNTPPVPTVPGVDGHIYSLGGTIMQKYYLVGRNLLFDDRGLNPDKWTSAYLSLGGLWSVSGNQTVSSGGPGIERDSGSNSLAAALGVKLPMTSAATIQLEFDASYAQSDAAEYRGLVAGSRSRTFQLGGLTSVRYYFF